MMMTWGYIGPKLVKSSTLICGQIEALEIWDIDGHTFVSFQINQILIDIQA